MADPYIDRASSFDPYLTYETIVAIEPIHDQDRMEGTRHAAIGFETFDGKIRDYRGSVFFDRFKGTSSYRFFIRGFQVERKEDGSLPDDDGEVGNPIESMELRLTARYEWCTKFKKIRGTASSGRIIRLLFLRPEEEQTADSIRQIDVIVPRTASHDKGKLLELAVEQAAAIVDAGIAERKFKEEAERQAAALNRSAHGNNNN
ncbi:unknown protein [Seminavis robusta]|uniref:Uncharacterized protein n=1 Tax=Seminavis robusta TaxID=568900 RepID=A0A9N8DLL8_9STRA|nr:unknown protein [Seminavis robusta]|eukprot:Sro227_g092390.1 n/a (203) ;mRNA; f:68148-68756